MSNQVIEVDAFLSRFQGERHLQEEFIRDPSAFLQNPIVPRAYADQIMAHTATLRTKSMTLLDEVLSDDGLVQKAQAATVRGAAKGTPHITLERARLFGLNLILDNQATDDIAGGIATAAVIPGMITAADPELLSKAGAAIITGGLLITAGVMKLMNRGKGVHYWINPVAAVMLPLTAMTMGPAAFVTLMVGPLPN